MSSSRAVDIILVAISPLLNYQWYINGIDEMLACLFAMRRRFIGRPGCEAMCGNDKKSRFNKLQYN
jgi:hypothetical protein